MSGRRLTNSFVLNVKAKDGESPIFADLDNGMGSVGCDKNGITTSEQFVSTNFSFFKGSIKQAQAFTSIVCTISGYPLGTAYDPNASSPCVDFKVSSLNLATGALTIGVRSGASLPSKVDVACAGTMVIDGVSVSRNLTLTINGVRAGADGSPAAIFSLVPSANQIVKKKGGGYDPTPTITCSVTKNVGGVSSTPSSSEYTLKMKVNGGSEQSYASVNTSTITSNIEYILYKDGVVVDRERIPLVTDGTDGIDGIDGIDGTSPITAIMDNGMDGVICDANGNTTGGEQTVSTTFTFYKGSTKQTQAFTSIVPTVDVFALDTQYDTAETPRKYFRISSLNLNSGYLEIAVKDGTALDKVEVRCDVTMTIDGISESRQFFLTIYGVRPGPQGEKATIYNIMPSPSTISFARENGILTPDYRSLSLTYRKNDGQTVSELTISTLEVTTRYSVSSMPSTASDGTLWGTSDGTQGLSWDMAVMRVANSVAFTNIHLAAFNASGVCVDRRTVSVVRDGADGEDGKTVEATISPSSLSIQCNSDGTVAEALSGVLNFGLKVDGNAASVTGMTPPTPPTGVTLESHYTGTYNYTIATTATASNLRGGLSFTVSGTYGGKTYSAIATLHIVPVEFQPVWSVEAYTQEARYSVDYAGVRTFSPSKIILRVHKTDANGSTQYTSPPSGMSVYAYARSDTSSSLGSAKCTSFTRTVATDAVKSGNVASYIEYCLFSGTSSSTTPLARCSVKIIKEVQRMLVPAGKYTDKEYNRTDRTTPLVLYEDPNSALNNTYWFLDADTNNLGVEGDPYIVPPGDSSGVWVRAEEYEVVLTKALFANFANVGGFIIYDHFFFSQCGTLVGPHGQESVGVEQSVTVYGLDNGDNITTVQSQMKASVVPGVPYSFFNPADPDASNVGQSDDIRFRPSKLIDAVTGGEWSANGKFRVKTEQNGGAVVSVDGLITQPFGYVEIKTTSWTVTNVMIDEVRSYYILDNCGATTLQVTLPHEGKYIGARLQFIFHRADGNHGNYSFFANGDNSLTNRIRGYRSGGRVMDVGTSLHVQGISDDLFVEFLGVPNITISDGTRTGLTSWLLLNSDYHNNEFTFSIDQQHDGGYA